MGSLPPNPLIPLIDEIKSFAAASSSGNHAKLLAKINSLLLAAETPLETIYRIGHQSWQNASVKIALDLGIFDALIEMREKGISAHELAMKCGADSVLVTRIMRVLTALGLCSELNIEEYKASNKTKILTVPQGSSSFSTWIDLCMPTAAKLPEYLKTHDYQNPQESTSSPFAYAFGSEFWSYLEQNPVHSAIFGKFMATRRLGRPSWFDIYPVDQELPTTTTEDLQQDEVLLIDIGGNRGHDLVNLKARYPHLPGKLILQDLPDIVAGVTFGEKSNITARAHNFFTPQPIKHARAYHFRAIFHDWPNEQCRQILNHTAAAMKPSFSKLLVSEFVLADMNTALFPASLDVQMMGLHAGMERSEKQWRDLLDSAGLEVVKIWQMAPGGESVIEAALKI